MKNLNLFLAQVKASGSEKTAKDYEKNVKKFFDYYKKEESEITYQDLLDYFNICLDKASINTKRTYMAAVLSYFKFLFSQDLIQKDITKAFRMPKAEIKDMEFLKPEEAKMVVESASLESRNRLRKKAMFITFMNTGMRSSELANLKFDEIKDGWIYVNNAKRNQFRRIPLHESVEKAIKDYVKYERKNVDCPYVFVNQAGNKLSTVNIDRDLDRIVNKANISKHISAHRLRDSFATNQYTGGTDIKSIQETLGHSKIQMTLHYIQKADEVRRNQILSGGISF